ncbi:MAG: ATP-binding protein [Planctomycetes bacterium]|nr:ATP-binding protein [Planctomycetota bacterium]
MSDPGATPSPGAARTPPPTPPTNAVPAADTAPALPAWFTRDLCGPFEAGIASVFLLHGDIAGLVPNPDAASERDRPYLSLRAFLEKVFDGGELVGFYDVASGLRCLTPAMERRLLELAAPAGAAGRAGAGGAGPGAARDPIAAAKNDLAARRGLPREPEACLPLVENALRTLRRAALVLESAHHVAPTVSAGIPLPPEERANIQRLRNWARDDAIRSRRNLVLLLTDQAAKVSSELRLADGGVPIVFLPKPTRAERLAFLRATAASGAGAADPAATPAPAGAPDLEAFAHATQGMSLRQIQDVLLRAREAGLPLRPEFVKEKKREILNAEYGDVMDVVDPVRGLEDIGGHEHVKRYFTEVLDGIRKGDARLVPMGVTLMGPPGTGKTALVEALAREAGFNFVKTKNVRSMWVGESEARMEKLVYGLRSLAPVVVMNDEADLAEGGRDAPRGDSGVSERLMKMWMELLSDPRIRGRIVVINCTNRPDRIDPALKRSGRSDERILIPMPSADERPAILRVLLRRHAIPTAIADLAAFAPSTAGLSGADLEKVCLSAYRFAREQGKSQVDEAVLATAIGDFIPSASQAEIDAMTLSGLLECSSRRLLPPNAEEIVAGICERALLLDMDDLVRRLTARNIVQVPASVRPPPGFGGAAAGRGASADADSAVE